MRTPIVKHTTKQTQFTKQVISELTVRSVTSVADIQHHRMTDKTLIGHAAQRNSEYIAHLLYGELYSEIRKLCHELRFQVCNKSDPTREAAIDQLIEKIHTTVKSRHDQITAPEAQIL